MDLGKVRIGIAIGESEPFVATPRPALRAAGSLRLDAATVADLARREGVERVVVGVPLSDRDPDGEGAMASVARRFGAEIAALGCEVGFADETMTSEAAGAAMAAAGLTVAQTRRRKDGEAACRILEAYVANPL